MAGGELLTNVTRARDGNCAPAALIPRRAPPGHPPEHPPDTVVSRLLFSQRSLQHRADEGSPREAAAL